MKIIVLAGGLSTERDVSLSSSAGICRTLLEKGHDAFLLDVFLGFPYDPEHLEEVFTLPDHGLGIVKNIDTTEPDIEAVKASRPDQPDCFLGPNVIEPVSYTHLDVYKRQAVRRDVLGCQRKYIWEPAGCDLHQIQQILGCAEDIPFFYGR